MYHQSFSFLDGDGDGLLRPGDVLAAVTAHEALRHHQAAAHFLEFVVATEGTVGAALAAGGGDPPLPTLHFHDYVRALRSQHGAMCRDLVVACAGVAEALRRRPLPSLDTLDDNHCQAEAAQPPDDATPCSHAHAWRYAAHHPHGRQRGCCEGGSILLHASTAAADCRATPCGGCCAATISSRRRRCCRFATCGSRVWGRE
jgi:hypothetical protein